MLGDGVFVTCQHCVPLDRLEPGQWYAGRRGQVAHALNDLDRSSQFDVAIGRVDVRDSPLVLAGSPPTDALGLNVGTFGYPGTRGSLRDQRHDDLTFNEHSRWLEGYVTWAFKHQPPGVRRAVPSWEVDMPGPEGISGAPLFHIGRDAEVIGMVYGRHVVHGEPDPELDPRLVDHVFTLAFHTGVLNDLTSGVLGERTLRQHLDALDA